MPVPCGELGRGGCTMVKSSRMLDKTPISQVRLLWISVAMFATDVLINRFLHLPNWSNCLKVWVNTGAFDKFAMITARPPLTESLIDSAFVATIFFFFFCRISRRTSST
jgi:hypothetical protein